MTGATSVTGVASVTGTVVSLSVFAVLLVTGLVLQVRGRRRPGAATAGQALAAVMRTAPGRCALLACWIWFGVHFLAR